MNESVEPLGRLRTPDTAVDGQRARFEPMWPAIPTLSQFFCFWGWAGGFCVRLRRGAGQSFSHALYTALPAALHNSVRNLPVTKNQYRELRASLPT